MGNVTTIQRTARIGGLEILMLHSSKWSLAASVIIAGSLMAVGSASAQLANIKVVTDASPDYSGMESMTRSITSRWDTDKEKMWAMFYWNHIARRQTSPIIMHGQELTDPIRQFNDYGFTMCSTISGVNMNIWQYMGYYGRYFDIALHTVPEVWYDGGWHHYDNSLSIIYTLCDGKTIAGITDVGKTLACEASGGKAEPGHIALYHALNGTGPNGFIEGADTMRDLRHVGQDCFSPRVLKYRYYYSGLDRGHRFILNLRDGETYTRHYSRQDANSSMAVSQDNQGSFRADPAYFIANDNGKDTEAANPRYHIRGNGTRTFAPTLTAEGLAGAAQSTTNIKAIAPAGLVPAKAGEPAEAIFKIEGGNVITSLKIDADVSVAGPEDQASIAISTNNGKDWKELWKTQQPGAAKADLAIIEPINGQYEALVKMTLLAKTDIANARLNSIKFDAITQLNAKTQPQLKLGKNTVYVGEGEQTGSIVLWPELQGGKYKPLLHEEKNIANVEKHIGYQGAIYQQKAGEDAYVIFKVDAPTDITTITYGGHFYNRVQKAHIDMLHSFDGGQTWNTSYSLTDISPPWDVVHYERATDIPAGTRSVLFKYLMAGPGSEPSACSIYAVHMEVNHKLVAPLNKPLEVTFTWDEVQKGHTRIERSHTQIVDKLPATYTIGVGGYDLPVVKSLTVNPQGSRGDDVKPGYSDGKDVGGEKWMGKWATYGKVVSQGKPYTVSVPPVDKSKAWGANDDTGTRLTDGRVGSSYPGGTATQEGPIWNKGSNPEIVVDLGQPTKLAAFRIHISGGYPWWDAIKGEVKDKVEVLVSNDGKDFRSVGNFDFDLYWKDVPVNYMWTDEESFCGHNHLLMAKEPVEARYVKYAVTPERSLLITEVQALDGVKLEPFDMKIALPDPADNGKAAPPPGVSPNAKKFDKPAGYGVEYKRSE